ncbi:MAG TPA: M18 family aminopeptidase [Candidatus Eisenbergiella merdipullorum]|uniref:M18 family aminopeptidase n=1 Tax=Candidatus Eisenbergiella merdipullorum TaxID=2838553 RepID=A0A9D2I2E7_9FIRM|nr:M18 family aminopeptidase [Candidatus Eisenbergiella merdipullorum]
MLDTEKVTQELFAYIDASPTAFHAAAEAASRLEAAGYEKLEKETGARIVPGGRYYMTRNDSSLIAFRVPEGELQRFRIAAAHSDSPSFKIKETPELEVEGHYVRLNTEGYGGMIQSTWLDRPLSVAGRVIVETENGPRTRLVNLDRDLCVIPNVAIHFNREINKGYAYNPQVDLLPLFSGMIDEKENRNGQKNAGPEEGEGQERGAEKASTLAGLCARELGIEEEKILASDLFLYNREKGRRMGAKGEFIGSPRLDDLQCAFGALKGFLLADGASEDRTEGGRKRTDEGASKDAGCCAVYALFDNEEIGSGTKQGADSTFLSDVLDCVCDALQIAGAKKRDILSESFLLSADNAHGVHPNHPEKSDPTNRPYLNGGIVLKFQGSQKYTTDAWSAAQVRRLCRQAGIPCQNFANRADIAGGSTLGNISSAHVSIPAADIGLAQLAMHSAFETAGALDTGYLIELCREYYA